MKYRSSVAYCISYNFFSRISIISCVTNVDGYKSRLMNFNIQVYKSVFEAFTRVKSNQVPLTNFRRVHAIMNHDNRRICYCVKLRVVTYPTRESRLLCVSSRALRMSRRCVQHIDSLAALLREGNACQRTGGKVRR